jgi:hypothetical protein
MKKTALLMACAALMVGGMSLAAPQTASAGIGVSFGNRWSGNGYSNRGYGNHGYQSNRYDRGYDRGYNRSNGYGYGNGWSGYGNRGGHYDYHPQTIVPHGNHYDVVPGHYDFHRGGHGHNH